MKILSIFFFRYFYNSQKQREKSSELSDGVFNSDWYKADNVNIKDLPFVVQICQQPRTIKLYKFSVASYSTCTGVSVAYQNIINQ